MLNDPSIRKALHSKLLRRQHSDPKTLIIEELGLEHGTARVDVATINGLIHGYEIKSDADDLSRLPHQIEVFSRVLDKLTVIAGDRHSFGCESALPSWCGLVRCRVGPRGAKHFETIRPAKQNADTNPLSVAMLLWRNEAVEVLRQLGSQPRVLRKSRGVLYDEIVDQLSHREVRTVVVHTLKQRIGWRDHR
jgi:hypothetical protein